MKHNINLKITNLGPIKEIDMDLGDITVIIGPPNSGKSFTLKALYTELLLFDSFNVNEIISRWAYDPFSELIKQALKEIRIKIKNLIEKNLDEDDKDYIDENLDIEVKGATLDTVLKNLNEEIKRYKEDIIPILATTKFATSINQVNLRSLLKNVLNVEFSIEGSSFYRYGLFRHGLSIKFLEINNTKVKAFLDDENRFVLKFELDIKLNKANSKTYIKKINNIDETFEFSESYAFLGIRNIRQYLADKIKQNIEQFYTDFYKDRFCSISSVSFVPFGRTPIIHLIEESKRAFSGYENLPIFNSYIQKINKGIETIAENKTDKEKNLNLFAALMQGSLEYDSVYKKLRYKRWGCPAKSDVPIKFSSALASEMVGILLPIINSPERSLIIIEEPESQLHISAQILLGMVFVALINEFKHKIIIGSHSDILVLTLAYLKELEYDEKIIFNLIKKLFKQQNISIKKEQVDQLVKSVIKSKDFDLKFFYYNNTKCKVDAIPKSPQEITSNVTGITEIVELLADWALNSNFVDEKEKN